MHDGPVKRSEQPPPERSVRGSDFLQLDLSHVARGGRATWLVDQLRTAVADGRLATGDVLPASRSLAGELGVSRGVVTEAYRRLADDGLVSGSGRRGTVVLGGPVRRSVPAPDARSPLPLDARESADAFGALRAVPAALDLSPGLPDLASFPRAAWLRAERDVLEGTPHRELGYADARGAPALRAAICGWVARTRGIDAAPDEVQVVGGVAQAIALFAHLTRESGTDTIAVEDPCSLGARQQLQAWGVRTRGVPVDGEGIDVDALTVTGAQAVMTTPAHQFPTGVVLSGTRRRQLSAWARTGGLVLEDDYDAEHRYDRPPVVALRATLPDHVYYTGSVSKTLAPALRLGWVLAPARVRPRLAALKRDSDLGSATVPQLVLARLMVGGDLERHLRRTRRRHRERRDALLESLAERLPGARVLGAAAGLHLTVLLPDGTDDLQVAADCLSLGVKVHPLTWHRLADGPPGLLIGYAASSPGVIDQGVATLARVLGGRT